MAAPEFDREVADLLPEARWRRWMGQVEAVLFASASPVPREDLARVVGQSVSVDLVIEDIQAELVGRPYELVAIAEGGCFAAGRSLAMPFGRQWMWVRNWWT